MNRRKFLYHSAVCSAFYHVKKWKTAEQTHVITFSFDDGFKHSFYRAAEIHEAYGMSACFNVIASGHLPSFKGVDTYIFPKLLGDFNDWNTLKSRGHEVMPHTWEHLNVTKISYDHAVENIDRCLEYFEENLDGYKNEEAVFNYAFGASTPEIEAYTLQKVLGARTGGWLFMGDEKAHALPKKKEPMKLGCWTTGPGNIDAYLEKEVNAFLASSGGWLIFNLHGFDDEGWGPVSTSYFDQLLKRLSEIKHVAVKPAGKVLQDI